MSTQQAEQYQKKASELRLRARLADTREEAAKWTRTALLFARLAEEELLNCQSAGQLQPTT